MNKQICHNAVFQQPFVQTTIINKENMFKDNYVVVKNKKQAIIFKMMSGCNKKL